jgi:HK97 family phage major capsid protein
VDPKAELTAIKAELRNIVTGAKSAARPLTDAEITTIETKTARAAALSEAIERAEKSSAIIGSLSAGESFEGNAGDPTGLKTGFLPTGAVKRVTGNVIGGRELKSLVAAGVVATPIPLDPEPIKLGTEPLGVLTLFGVTQRDSEDYSYLRQTVRTDNAAIVAPGAAKPTSIYTVTKVSGHLDTYAHLSQPVGKYLLKDAPSLERFLSSEMNFGVLSAFEAHAITTINTTSGIQTVAAKDEPLASIYSGIVKVTGLGFAATAIVLNPDDWEDLVTTRNAGGTFDVSGTVGATDIQPTLYGRPVILTSGQTAGTALVLDRSAVGISTDRFGVESEWNPYSGFNTNEVTARVEARFALDVFQPAAVAKVTLSA